MNKSYIKGFVMGSAIAAIVVSAIWSHHSVNMVNDAMNQVLEIIS